MADQPRLQMPRLVIFDLDGTLVDSVPDIAVALDAALTEMDLPTVGEARTRRWVGNGARMLVRRAMAFAESGVDDGNAPENPEISYMLRLFLKHYREALAVHTTVYMGAEELLDFLRDNDCHLAVVTNKPEDLAIGVLQELGLGEYFSLVMGGDSLERKKPDPMPIQHLMTQFGARPEDVLVVGDSESDILAANAAGVDSVCVTYGYNQGLDPHSLGATVVIDSLEELPALIAADN